MKIFKIYVDSFKGLSAESWMLSIVMLINRSGSMVLPFLGVYMTAKLGFTIEQTGLVLSFYGIGSVIGSFMGGYLTDKFGEYKVQSLSLFISAPIFLLIPFFSTVAGMAFIIFLQSSISEVFRPANSVAITKYAKPENLTRAFSLNRMAVNLGFSIGPALGGILSAISYNFLFVVNFVAILAAGIMYVRFFKKRNKLYRNRIADVAEVITPTKNVYKSPYLDVPFLVFSLFCAIFAICFFQIINTLPLFFKDVVALDQIAIGYILGYSGFLIVLIEMLLVNLSEKYLSIASTLLIGSVFCAIGYAVLGFDYALLTIIFSMTFMSIGEILVLPFMSTVTAIRSEGANRGAYMGVNGIAFSLSFIITPFLGTRIASHFGFDTLWIYTGLFLILAGFGLFYTTKLIIKQRSNTEFK
ncbi:MFS transporter [Flavobacterium agricola]|uniref:MFS transporter n=1 Tax=Flavobacterium agricola TaxID=2870839 RepID=A0ABY6M0X1_9FLAO|nr:MFS transporter [Flavobacterium agricola]UYW01467.1 MFS transporter [Flavobacterium agricola]